MSREPPGTLTKAPSVASTVPPPSNVPASAEMLRGRRWPAAAATCTTPSPEPVSTPNTSTALTTLSEPRLSKTPCSSEAASTPLPSLVTWPIDESAMLRAPAAAASRRRSEPSGSSASATPSPNRNVAASVKCTLPLSHTRNHALPVPVPTPAPVATAAPAAASAGLLERMPDTVSAMPLHTSVSPAFHNAPATVVVPLPESSRRAPAPTFTEPVAPTRASPATSTSAPAKMSTVPSLSRLCGAPPNENFPALMPPPLSGLRNSTTVPSHTANGPSLITSPDIAIGRFSSSARLALAPAPAPAPSSSNRRVLPTLHKRVVPRFSRVPATSAAPRTASVPSAATSTMPWLRTAESAAKSSAAPARTATVPPSSRSHALWTVAAAPGPAVNAAPAPTATCAPASDRKVPSNSNAAPRSSVMVALSPVTSTSVLSPNFTSAAAPTSRRPLLPKRAVLPAGLHTRTWSKLPREPAASSSAPADVSATELLKW